MMQESLLYRSQFVAEHPPKRRSNLLNEWLREAGNQPSCSLMDEWLYSLKPPGAEVERAEAGRRLAHLREVAGRFRPTVGTKGAWPSAVQRLLERGGTAVALLVRETLPGAQGRRPMEATA